MFHHTGNTEKLFEIDSTLGSVSLRTDLIPGVTTLADKHLLVVRATDHALEPRSSSAELRITVTAAKDAPPNWSDSSPAGRQSPISGYGTPSSYHHSLDVNHARQVVEVSEWAPRGTAVAIATVTSPRSSMHYTILDGNSPLDGNEEGMFLITPSSGVISLATLLDREKCPFYNLTVSATNSVSALCVAFVSVTLRMVYFNCCFLIY